MYINPHDNDGMLTLCRVLAVGGPDDGGTCSIIQLTWFGSLGLIIEDGERKGPRLY